MCVIQFHRVASLENVVALHLSSLLHAQNEIYREFLVVVAAVWLFVEAQIQISFRVVPIFVHTNTTYILYLLSSAPNDDDDNDEKIWNDKHTRTHTCTKSTKSFFIFRREKLFSVNELCVRAAATAATEKWHFPPPDFSFPLGFLFGRENKQQQPTDPTLHVKFSSSRSTRLEPLSFREFFFCEN